MERLTFSVVICVYADDRWKRIVAAIESIWQQQDPPAEVIVVVDHNPLLLQRLQAELPSVTVIENQEIGGLSGARNSGVRASSGDIVAFLDDDAWAAPDWLAWLRAGYATPSVAGVGGAIIPAWSTDRPGWFPEEFDWVVGCTYRGMPEATAPVRNLIGANMSFRREIIELVGGFRSGIGRVGTRPVGCEETEFCIRVCQRIPGSVFVFEPRAQIRHHVPTDRATWRYFRQRCYAEGRSKALVSRFVGTTDGLASEWKYTLGALPRAIARAAAAAVVHRNRSDVGRAVAIVSGLFITSTGYLAGRVSTWSQPQRSARRLRSVGAGVLMSAETIAWTGTPDADVQAAPPARRGSLRELP